MAQEKTENANFDWEPIMAAIMKVESNGNPKAKNGNQVGALQITPILVKECNRILARNGSSKRFTLADRYNVEKSKEMFLVIQSAYNPKNDVEHAIRSWNGGIRYTVQSTQRYYNNVMKYLKDVL
ncbi:MAG: transglycosylase SLT domain-containing protein [Prevotellaceae bacterium]|nr:transglycosylase SLT domain-containing protein [Prevotellaceae bacterium]